jgi:hypothetical protein
LPSRPNWLRALPRALVILQVMTVRTLDDVRELMRHLPRGHREKATWQHVAAQLIRAANGADTVDVAAALQMVLSMEGVEFRPK